MKVAAKGRGARQRGPESAAGAGPKAMERVPKSATGGGSPPRRREPGPDHPDAVAAARAIAADCLCFRARRAARVITRTYDEALRPLGIRATQLTVLNAVAIGGEQGAGIGRLADVLGMDPTTLTRNLGPLERRGFIRIEEGGDPRSRVARLRPAGARILCNALPLWREAHTRVMDALGAEAAGELRRRLDEVAEIDVQSISHQSIEPPTVLG